MAAISQEDVAILNGSDFETEPWTFFALFCFVLFLLLFFFFFFDILSCDI